MLELIDAFIELLDHFDYSFDYSDDISVYRKGIAQHTAINERMMKHPSALTPIYNAYRHYWWEGHDAALLEQRIAQHKAETLITA